MFLGQVTGLLAHPWPGSGRELQKVLANLAVTGRRYGPVVADSLPAAFRRRVGAERRSTFAGAREDMERTMVSDVLGRHASTARGAGEMGIRRQALSKLAASFPVDRLDHGCGRAAHRPTR